MSESARCPACAGDEVHIFLRLEQVPVHQNLLMPTREAAQQCARGDIALGLCRACGVISNLAFEPSRLSYLPQYDNTQSFSSLFRAYMEGLASYLISRYGLHDRQIIDIGCGTGEFLTMLCELGRNQGLGFDPSYAEDQGAPTARVKIIRDFYSERYADYEADLVCARHVLEHIQYPAELLAGLRRSLGERAATAVFFEVPSVRWILRNLTFWDVFYEHCSYFSPGSLTRLLMSCGFNVVRIKEAFGDQYLWVEAVPDGDSADTEALGLDEPLDIAQDVEFFSTRHRQKVEALQEQMDKMESSGKRCVVWGAGAKGVTFLNRLDIRPEFIPYAVDINPRKQGMYVPGTGQEVISPDFLKAYSPNVIFVMNPNYLEEIREAVVSMGISSEMVTL